MQHMNVGRREMEVNAFEASYDAILTVGRRCESHKAVLPGVARFHCDLAGANSPAVSRFGRGLLASVVGNVGIVTRSSNIIRSGMPEAGGIEPVEEDIATEVIRRKRIPS